MQRGWLMTYGGSIYAADRAKSFLWPLLFGPEYTLGTRLSFPACFSASIDAMWDVIEDIDLPSQIPRLEVPVLVPSVRAESWIHLPRIPQW